MVIKEIGKEYTPKLSNFYDYWDNELDDIRQLILSFDNKKERDKFVKRLEALEESIRNLGVIKFA